jgi:hypothetical protein
LLIILVFAVFWAVSMQRQIKRIAAGNAAPAPVRKPPTVPTPSGPGLEAAQTPQDISRFLQNFAHDRWNLPATASLETIFAAWPKPVGIDDDRSALTRDLGAALYANKQADISDLKRRLRALIAAMPPDAKKLRKMGEKLPGLNPE